MEQVKILKDVMFILQCQFRYHGWWWVTQGDRASASYSIDYVFSENILASAPDGLKKLRLRTSNSIVI